MALTRIKTWIAEQLAYSDLNAEFDNILNNGTGSLGSPRTAAFDLDGNNLILDGAAATSLQSSTTNLIDIYGASTLLFKIDMTVATPVNALAFAATATGNAPTITARGSDTNISMNLVSKGTGTVQVNGTAISTPDSDQSVLASLIFG